ncbi:MAG: outer membrane protein assembly factor BamE [Burkholderiales bacterium]|nr:outer membrane protein assembly factor BamE [Burkholderiales bacterium]
MKAAPVCVAVAALVGAAGCASYDGRGLVPGHSSAAEVEARMGPPAERLALAGGETVWFYPRNPYGLQTFAVRLSPEGVVREIDQRLTIENVRRLTAGRSTAKDVREILGPPWRVSRLPRQQREVWHYRMDNGLQVEHDLFVQFSDDGVVRKVLLLRDPKYDQGAPGWN